MNLVGYLITLANLQYFQGAGGPLKDLSVRVSPVETLVAELKSQPEFQLEKFKETGYYRVGNVGKYLSNKVLNYIYKKNVDPKDEGIILTLNFAGPIDASDTTNGRTIRSSITPKGQASNHVKEGIEEYLDGLKNKRNRRSLLAHFKN